MSTGRATKDIKDNAFTGTLHLIIILCYLGVLENAKRYRKEERKV